MRTLIVGFIALGLLAVASPAAATRQVRVFETNVSSQADPAVQAQSGLRVVLVRATGARDAANDPALAGVLAQAQTYVIATRPAATGSDTLPTGRPFSRMRISACPYFSRPLISDGSRFSSRSRTAVAIVYPRLLRMSSPFRDLVRREHGPDRNERYDSGHFELGVVPA